MSVVRSAAAVLVLVLAIALPAHADSPREPHELVRSLRALQDQIIRGSRTAHNAHRRIMATIAEQLMRVEPERWREPRNARAGVLFALSGGDPRVVRHVLGLGGLRDPEERLLKGALAYAEGRNTEAVELLGGIDALTLDPGIAGHVALAQAGQIVKTDTRKAIDLLEKARLMAPGTLVEEASLRREILLLSTLGEVDRFETLAARYLRRYPKSLYGVSFRRQLATEIAALKDWNDPRRLERLQALLEALDASERQEVYLLMAQESILKGHIGLTRFAANQINAGGHEAARPQSRLYEAAALIVTDQFESGVGKLRAVDRTRLEPRDVELLDAALRVSEQIRRWPEPGMTLPTSAPPLEGASHRARELATAGARVIELAQSMIAKVDAVLNRGAK